MKTRDMGGHVLAGGRGGGRNRGVERAFFVENVSGSSRMLGFGSGDESDDVEDRVGTGIATLDTVINLCRTLSLIRGYPLAFFTFRHFAACAELLFVFASFGAHI